MKPTIALAGGTSRFENVLERLENDFDTIFYTVPATKEEFFKDCLPDGPLANIQGLFCSWPAFYAMGGLKTEEEVNQLPKGLKVVSLVATGYDQFNVAAFNKRGIVVTNTPSMDPSHSAEQVADIALYLSIGCMRKIPLFEGSFQQEKNSIDARRVVAKGEFDPVTGRVSGGPPAGFAFGDLTAKGPARMCRNRAVGVAGLGNIGKAIVRRLAPLGVEIHYHKRSPLTDQEIKDGDLPANLTFHASFDELCKVSDQLILALPGGPETVNIVNKRTLSLMPWGSSVVNIGRGTLINEDDLLEALGSKQLAMAGLDVQVGEPFVNPKLFGRWDIQLLPHLGSGTEDNAKSAELNVLNNIENVLNGGPGLHPVS
ncbi:putative 2-hydroxyacid dehydrogenase [Yarrowia sp. C11]|nr:putative 2-hydroxyacid dehydrogenase [Yarrowia sp. C11]KAG5370609.1 putative 2-hydroxyacid dehydrogenase [Yarrowia sp. E02]